MSHSDNICSGCGRLKSKPLEPKPDYSERKSGKSVDFFSMTKNLILKNSFEHFIVLLIFLILSMFSIFKDETKLFVVCGVSLIIVSTIITAVSCSRCHVLVYQSCVCGVIPTKIPFITKRFTVYYEDIIKVKAHGIGMSSSTTKHSNDSHPKFVIITDFGAIEIKGLNDTQAIHLRNHIKHYTDKLERM